MLVTRTFAGFAVLLVLSVSLSSALCDASCAFGQPQGAMLAMDQVHCQHEITASEGQPTIQASSSCHHHHPCADRANLSVQKLRPTSTQLSLAVLNVVAHLQRHDASVLTQYSRINDCTNPLASTPATSLRI